MTDREPRRYAASGGALVLVAVAAALYLPLLGERGLADHDALANVARIRADGGGLGWPDGFFVVSAGLRSINVLLNLSGVFHNHYYLAYQILVWICLAGMAVGLYRIVSRYAGRRDLGMLLGLMLLTLPAEVRLMRIFEDNLVAAMAQLITMAVCLRVVEALTGEREFASSAGERVFLYAVLPCALALAALSHRQFVVLWVTPVLLFFIPRPIFPRRCGTLVLSTYLIAGGVFLFVFAALTWYWDGVLTFGGWLRHLKGWVFPVRYYQDFYFFNQAELGIGGQARLVAQGLSRVVACGIAMPLIPLMLWLITGLLLVWRTRWRAACADPIARVCFLFAAVHVPHSLVYESANVERWDATVVPLLALVARLFSLPREATAARRSEPLFALLCALIVAMNLWGYAIFTRELRTAGRNPVLVGLMPLLERNVIAEHADDSARRLIVLDQSEYETCYMVAEAFYDAKRSLLILTPDGELMQNKGVYPQPMPLDPARWAERFEGRLIVASPGVARRLQQVYDLPAGQFEAPADSSAFSMRK